MKLYTMSGRLIMTPVTTNDASQPSNHSLFVNLSLENELIATGEILLNTREFQTIERQYKFVDRPFKAEDLIEKYMEENFKLSYYLSKRVFAA